MAEETRGSSDVCIVCNKKIENKDKNVSTWYKGNIYYFDSKECKVLFDENPTQYVTSEDETETIDENL